MKQVMLVITACSALVVAYFVTSVFVHPAGEGDAQAQAHAPTTQPETKQRLTDTFLVTLNKTNSALSRAQRSSSATGNS